MKNILLTLSLVLMLAGAAQAASFDSQEATIQKNGAHKAKVMLGKKSYPANVKFSDDASWTSVKDHYEVSPEAASDIKSGKGVITIAPDGKASFTKKK